MIPKSPADTILITPDLDNSTQPFRHRKFVGKLVVVDDPPLLYLHNRLVQASPVGKPHLMAPTSPHLFHN